MKTSSARAVAFVSVLALLARGAGAASADDSCARLTDAESTFRSSIVMLYQRDPYLSSATSGEFDFAPLASAFKRADDLAPWFSQCAASIDVEALWYQLWTNDKLPVCMKHVEALEWSMSNLTDSAFYDSHLCPLYDEVVVSCMSDVAVTKLLAPALQSPCCDDMRGVIDQAFGADLSSLVGSLTRLLGNVLCSTKTSPSAGGEVTKTCAEALAETFLQPVSDDGGSESEDDADAAVEPQFDVILDAALIPTDQVCAAVAGKSFLLTTKETSKFEPDADGISFGICFEPVDDLVDYVSAWPVLKTLSVPGENDASIPLTNLWDAGTCMPMFSLLAGILSENSSFSDAIDLGDAILSPMFTIVEGLFSAIQSPSPQPGVGGVTVGAPGGNDSTVSSEQLPTAPGSRALASRLLQTFQTWTITVFSDSDGSASSWTGDSADDGDDDSDSGDASSAPTEVPTMVPEPTVPSVINATQIATSLTNDVDFDLCLHFPHGVTCDYGAERIRFAYPNAASSAFASPSAPGSQSKKARAALHAAKSTLRRAHH